MFKSLALAGFVTFALLATQVRADIPNAAPATQPTAQQYQELKDRLDRIEAREAAEAATPGITLKTTTPDAGKGSDDVVSGITGGWDGTRFTLSSEDGNFTLHPGVVLDVRDMISYRVDVPKKYAGEVAASGYDTQNGVDLSRARFIFDGTLFHQASYFVQLSADQGSSLTLLDAAASYRFGDSPFTAKVGQFKDPVWHERNISESSLMAVDRSLLEYYLEGGQGSRVQGGAITFDQDRVRAQLVAHDGFNTQNTKFFDAGGDGAGVAGESGVTPTDFGFSGRTEYMLIGHRTRAFNPFNEYEQFTSLHARQDILVVGGGADFTQAASNDLIAHSVDIQYNSVNGLSLFGEYAGTYRGLHTNQGVAAGYYYDSGFMAQAAYVFDQQIEPFVRYDWTHLDPSSTRGVAGINSHLIQELTVGANYYIYGQKLKLTVDGSWLPNGSPGDSDALGVLRDSGKYEFVLRTQLQLAL
jgi:hypothetical protein